MRSRAVSLPSRCCFSTSSAAAAAKPLFQFLHLLDKSPHAHLVSV